MKRIAVFVGLLTCLCAQTDDVTTCHVGERGEKACHCLSHSRAVRDKAEAECQDKTKDEQDACYKAIPEHCAIIKRADYDEMTAHCTPVCKKHRCSCDDGPTCNVGYGYEDEGEHQ